MIGEQRSSRYTGTHHRRQRPTWDSLLHSRSMPAQLEANETYQSATTKQLNPMLHKRDKNKNLTTQLLIPVYFHHIDYVKVKHSLQRK